MLIRSFLKAFAQRLKSTPAKPRRRSTRNSDWAAEVLESRALLANVTLSNIEAAPLVYVEQSTTPITGTLIVAVQNAQTIDQATVQISSNYTIGQDHLLFTNTAKLTGLFNSVNGTLTITGTGTAAEYQTALQSVTYYNLHDNPSPLTRAITFQAGTNPVSNSVVRNVLISPVNDPPVVKVDSGALNYLENGITPISPNLLVTDPDNTTLPGATIKITGNYQMFEDKLVFNNTANIKGTWDVNTGTLTLTGVDTVSNYRTALRSVSFQDIKDNPSIVTRTVSFFVTDGSLNSNTGTRDINVIPVNDPPQVSGIESTALTYTQNDPAITITNTLLLVDPDSTTLTSAKVTITGNYKQGADVLGFTNTANITGSWNANTGTLTLTGTDSVSNYRSALRTVQFFASSAVPGNFTRTISFSASDGISFGNSVSRDIKVIGDPFLTGIESTMMVYNTPNATQQITATLTVEAFNNKNITGAQVWITNSQSSDTLTATPMPGITFNWDPVAGVLTFTGSATAADYQAILRTVAYNNPSQSPTGLHRQFNFQVFEGALPSNVVFRNMNFTAASDPPELSQVETTPLQYKAGMAATSVSSTINVFDPDRLTLTGAVIQFVPLTGNYRPPQDTLVFVDTPTIKGVWTPATGKLTLSGTDTVANYQAALRSVKYFNTAPTVVVGTRQVMFRVADGDQRGAPDSNIVTRDISVSQT